MIIELGLSAFIAIIPTTASSTIHVQNVAAARAAASLPSEWQPFRDCVAARESSGRYDAQNPVSSAQGKFQFLDSQWRHGGGWNVWKRLLANGYDRNTAKRLLSRLHATPIKQWRPVYQDILFASVVTSRQGMGWRHWHLAGSRCNTLVPNKN